MAFGNDMLKNLEMVLNKGCDNRLLLLEQMKYPEVLQNTLLFGVSNLNWFLKTDGLK